MGDHWVFGLFMLYFFAEYLLLFWVGIKAFGWQRGLSMTFVPRTKRQQADLDKAVPIWVKKFWYIHLFFIVSFGTVLYFVIVNG